MTLNDLRKSESLNEEVVTEMKRLGLDLGQLQLSDSKNSEKLPLTSSKSQIQKGKSKTEKSKTQKVVKFSKSSSSGKESCSTDSDSDSSSNDSSDYDLSSRLSSSNSKSKKLKSGLTVKSADKVVNPQFFPHNFLQYEYVSKDLEFKQLNFKMFVAGELEIINNFFKNRSEKEGRLKFYKKFLILVVFINGLLV